MHSSNQSLLQVISEKVSQDLFFWNECRSSRVMLRSFLSTAGLVEILTLFLRILGERWQQSSKITCINTFPCLKNVPHANAIEFCKHRQTSTVFQMWGISQAFFEGPLTSITKQRKEKGCYDKLGISFQQSNEAIRKVQLSLFTQTTTSNKNSVEQFSYL